MSSFFKPGLIAFSVAMVGLTAAPAKATVIFSEDFESEAPTGSALNYNGFNQFDITSNAVDYVKTGDYGITCAGGAGYCIDLDGGQPGDDPTIKTTRDLITLTAGREYSLSFDYSGGQKPTSGYTIGDATAPVGEFDTITVKLGDLVEFTIDQIAQDQEFITYTYLFSTTETVGVFLSFIRYGTADFVGAKLDNIVLEEVGVVETPIPAAGPLLISGIAGLLWASRRKRAVNLG